MLTEDEKRVLLKLAREAIELWVRNRQKPPLPEALGNLDRKAGVFISLYKRKRLRGCIGHVVSQKPLIETVQALAILAATKDTRFQPVTIEELRDLTIQLSILSTPEGVSDVNQIEVGRHGLLLYKDGKRGVLLPQVASERGWDRETFLRETCLKAGLSEDAWKDPAVTIETFSTDVFDEKSVGLKR